MEIDFMEYKVLNRDTLQSVASRLGMTSEELKQFHNSYCPKMDTIWFENLNGIKKILVPPNFKTQEKKELERKNHLPSAQLPDSFFAQTYTVHETIENLFEPSVNIEYTIDLRLRKDKNKNLFVFSYTQQDFKNNGTAADDKVSSLSIACMRSIMPIDFTLDIHGKPYGLADHKRITETFAEQRKELEGFFIGEINQNYMNSFEKNIADEKFLLKQFQSTLLFQSLFPKLEWFHKTTAWKEAFSFYQNSFPIQCEMNIEQENEGHDFVTTIIKGNSTEFYSLQEIKTGRKHHEVADDPILGEIIIDYTTHKKSKSIIQIESSVILQRDEDLIQKHNLTITQG